MSNETLMERYARLAKAICDCQHALKLAERLKVKGQPAPMHEVEAVQLKLKDAIADRDFLDRLVKKG